MICRNCSSEIPDNVSTCPKCGSYTGVVQQKFCQKCGAQVKPTDEFCTSCGAYTEKKKTEINTDNASVAGLAGLSFVIPILGFILAAVNSKKNPDGAKVILGASIIGFIIEASVFLPSLMFYLNL